MKVQRLVALAVVPTILYSTLMLLLSRRVFWVGAGVSSSSWVTTTTMTMTTSTATAVTDGVTPAHPQQPQQQTTILRMSSSSNEDAANTVHKIPRIGLGTYMMDRDQIRTALPSAIAAGYRRIDCAPVYFNEDAVGDVLAELLGQQQQQGESTPPQRNSIQRSDLYVVSKLPSPFHRNVEAAVRKTLNDLRLDYLDLYLGTWIRSFWIFVGFCLWLFFGFPPLCMLTVYGYTDEITTLINDNLSLDACFCYYLLLQQFTGPWPTIQFPWTPHDAVGTIKTLTTATVVGI